MTTKSEDEDLPVLFRAASRPLPAPGDPQLADVLARLGLGPRQCVAEAIEALARAADDPLRSPANRARARAYLDCLG